MNNIQSYRKKYSTFATSLLKHYAASKQGMKNIILSPFSVLLLLCIAADAADGLTRKEIAAAISDDRSYGEIRELLHNLSEVLTQSPAMTSANAVCVKKECADILRPEYIKSLEDYFQGKLFTSSDLVRDVNTWVRKKTNGMITELADEACGEMLLCLMNAVSFEAEWEQQYEEDDIQPGEFTDFSGVIREVPILESKELSYIEDADFKGFVKPCKNKGYSFMALLPRQKTERFLKNAIARTDLSELFLSQTQEEVYVSIPEFKYSFASELTAFCKKAGIQQVFTPDADFSPMATEKLIAENILHKAFIEVDRKGTKAAVATAMVLSITGVSLFKTVNLNRPFVFAIMHNETALPVFAGILTDVGEEYPEVHYE